MPAERASIRSRARQDSPLRHSGESRIGHVRWGSRPAVRRCISVLQVSKVSRLNFLEKKR